MQSYLYDFVKQASSKRYHVISIYIVSSDTVEIRSCHNGRMVGKVRGFCPRIVYKKIISYLEHRGGYKAIKPGTYTLPHLTSSNELKRLLSRLDKECVGRKRLTNPFGCRVQ